MFGLIAKAADQWPESHPFQPADAEHLRAWLLVEARYHDTEFLAYPEECAASPAIKSLFKLAVEASYSAFTRKRGHAFIRISAGGVEILTPRSIDFATISQKEFGPIREAVEVIIESALGVPASQILREQAA